MPFIGRQPLVGNYIKLDAITTSATATYNLTAGGVAVYPQTATNCIVSLNGIIQAPTDAYTISGSTIVFASALTTSDVIDFITVLGDVLNIGTPSDGTVSLAKLTATGTKDSTTFLRGDNTFQTIGKNTPAFYVYLNSDVVVTDATNTKIPFNQKEFDTDSAFDNTTNYRFTVPSGKGGKYFIHYNATGSTDPSRLQYVGTYLYKNGSAVSGNFIDPRNAGFGLKFSVGNQLHLNLSAGDYLEVYIIVDPEGNALYTPSIVGSTYTTSFGGHKIIE